MTYVMFPRINVDSSCLQFIVHEIYVKDCMMKYREILVGMTFIILLLRSSCMQIYMPAMNRLMWGCT